MTNTANSGQIALGIESLNRIIGDLQPKKLMIVADASYPFLSIRNKIDDIPVPHIMFNQFGANPLYEDVCKGVALFNQSGCDALLAIGGGSSIDVAKCIKLYCRMKADTPFLFQEYADSHIPLIAIPTTAGTGSESTRFAVIYYKGAKQSVTHPSIIPNHAILEPSVLSTLPAYQKKCTLLDALCQGIESWWSINSTPESVALSAEAVRTICANIDPYIFDNSIEAAANIMQAANKSGQAINITQTTAPHAFSYKLTSLYHLPHGHAVAICLPHIWQYMIAHPDKCIDPRGWAHLDKTFGTIAHAMQCRNAAEAIECFRALLKKLGIEAPACRNRAEELTLLTASVNPERLKNNPVRLDTQTIHTLYNNILP